MPVTFVDNTAGYDSECAVLFPETVERRAAGRSTTSAGSSATASRSASAASIASAADLLGVNLPPDAAALLASERLSLDAYMLWDLIHDRAHCTATCRSTRS